MTNPVSRQDTKTLLDRIDEALDSAERILEDFTPGGIEHSQKKGGDPVTEADVRLDRALRHCLLAPGEGWLSEETKDDSDRLSRPITWIVDPLDGTKEFVQGLAEFCVSVAAVENGKPVAGGITNPAAGIRISGAVGIGVFVNRSQVRPGHKQRPLNEMSVLASRSEVRRGEWEIIADAGINVIPMGSVAYKMARVAAGLSDATWTLIPKHEWDVAGGAALLAATGGSAVGLDGRALAFNRPNPLLEGVIAVPPGFERHVPTVLGFRSN